MARVVRTIPSRNPYTDCVLTDNRQADDRPGASARTAFTAVGDDGRTEAFTRGHDDVSALTNPAEGSAFKLALEPIADRGGLSFVEVANQGAEDPPLGAGLRPGRLTRRASPPG